MVGAGGTSALRKAKVDMAIEKGYRRVVGSAIHSNHAQHVGTKQVRAYLADHVFTIKDVVCRLRKAEHFRCRGRSWR